MERRHIHPPTTVIEIKPLVVLALLGLGICGSGAAAAPAIAQQDAYATDASAAAEYFESRVDDWLEGPVEYIILDEERSAWNKLETTAQRQAFINWFWARRDVDSRDREHPFRESFYALVADANRRFRGFPRGWRSDRGRVYVIIGWPDLIRRSTSAHVLGVDGPDFDVWTYFSSGNNPGLGSVYGEVEVFFIESSPATTEIYDQRFGTGVYPPWLRSAFEYRNEGAIVDRVTKFEPDADGADFADEAAEVALAIEVPLEEWAEPGGGPVAMLPVCVALRDLLFQPDGGGFLVELDADLVLTPPSGGETLRLRQHWAMRLSEDQLAQHGTDSLSVALPLPASGGQYSARIDLSQQLAGSRGTWQGQIDVVAADDPGGTVVVGTLSLPLDPAQRSTVGIIGSSERQFASGAPIVVVVWVRGGRPHGVRLSVTDGEVEAPLVLSRSSWLGSSAGPVLIEAQLPELPPGDYRLRVDFGSDTEVDALRIRISG